MNATPVSNARKAADLGELRFDAALDHRSPTSREGFAGGLENAPEAIFGTLTGRNLGKLLLQVGPDPTR